MEQIMSMMDTMNRSRW